MKYFISGFLLMALPFWVMSQQAAVRNKVTTVKPSSKSCKVNGVLTNSVPGIADSAILVIGEKRWVRPVIDRKFYFDVPVQAFDEKAVLLLHYNNQTQQENTRRSIKDTRRFFLDTVIIEMTIGSDLPATLVQGGRQNKALDEYLALTAGLRMELDSLWSLKYEKAIADSTYATERKKRRTELIQREKQFVSDFPWSWTSLEILDEQVKTYLASQWAKDPLEIELKEYCALLLALQEPVREKAQYLLTHLRNAEENKLIHFTGEMPDGKIFDIASLKGRVFLIDFWGSWCVWCRKGHPHLKELYAKYKNKGFEIVGVGHEIGGPREEQWRKFKEAIAKDGITWPQILNDPAKRDLTSEYLVRSYPSKFLVDQNGRVILRVGDDNERLIDAKLKELLGPVAGE